MNTMSAIRIEEVGGPEKLQLVDVPRPDPKPGEIRIRHTAIGVNFIDTYHRSGLYPVPLPSGLGMEAAGEVDAIGEGVTGWQLGDRAGYCSGPLGAYAQAHCVPASTAFKLPGSISNEAAAALLLKGLTAQMLLRQIYPVQAGETILVHAAAGGVGLILCQWAKHLGARVIGTVGSEEKAAIARANGCDDIIFYRTEPVAERLSELTNGQKVPVVFDGIGKTTFEASLNCLSPRGILISYGNASGPVTGVDLATLAAKGSLFITRPTLYHYIDTPERRQASVGDLFAAIAAGTVTTLIGQKYELADTQKMHMDLEARNTHGVTLLIP